MFGYDKPELWNTVIKTYPAVSQFWTYGKDKFLTQPVYSRDFPTLQILRVRFRAARNITDTKRKPRHEPGFLFASDRVVRV
jgi:hypothetical protein